MPRGKLVSCSKEDHLEWFPQWCLGKTARCIWAVPTFAGAEEAFTPYLGVGVKEWCFVARGQ